MLHLLSFLLLAPAQADCDKQALDRALTPLASASFAERPPRTVEALNTACTLSEELHKSLRIWAHMEDKTYGYLRGLGCDPEGERLLSRVLRQLDDRPPSIDDICAVPLQAVTDADLELDEAISLDQRLLYGQVLGALEGLPRDITARATHALRHQGLGIGSLVQHPWSDLSAPTMFSSVWSPLMDKPFESIAVERRCLVYAGKPTPTDCATPVIHVGRKAEAGDVFSLLDTLPGQQIRFLLPVRNGTNPWTLPRVVDVERSSDSVVIDIRIEPFPGVGYLKYGPDSDLYATLHMVDGSNSKRVPLGDLRRALRDMPDGTVRVSTMANTDARALLSGLVGASLDGRKVVPGDGAACDPYRLREFAPPTTPAEAIRAFERSCNRTTLADRAQQQWLAQGGATPDKYPSWLPFRSTECSKKLELSVAAPFDLELQAATIKTCGVAPELAALGIDIAPWWSADHALFVLQLAAPLDGLAPELRDPFIAPFLRPYDNHTGLRASLLDTHVRNPPPALQVPLGVTRSARCVVRPDRGETTSCTGSTTLVLDHLTGASLDAWLAASDLDEVGVLVASSQVLTVTAPRSVALSLLPDDQRYEREHPVELYKRDGAAHARGLDPLTREPLFDVPVSSLEATLRERPRHMIRLHAGGTLDGETILRAVAASSRAKVPAGWGPLKPDAAVVAAPRLGAPNGILGALESHGGHHHRGLQGIVPDAPARGIALGDVLTLHDLDESLVLGVLEHQFPALQECYDRLGQNQTGATAQRITIGADGQVTDITTESSSIYADGLVACLQGVLKQARFPDIEGGGSDVARVELMMGR